MISCGIFILRMEQILEGSSQEIILNYFSTQGNSQGLLFHFSWGLFAALFGLTIWECVSISQVSRSSSSTYVKSTRTISMLFLGTSGSVLVRICCQLGDGMVIIRLGSGSGWLGIYVAIYLFGLGFSVWKHGVL
jgi:hypothetical protein